MGVCATNSGRLIRLLRRHISVSKLYYPSLGGDCDREWQRKRDEAPYEVALAMLLGRGRVRGDGFRCWSDPFDGYGPLETFWGAFSRFYKNGKRSVRLCDYLCESVSRGCGSMEYSIGLGATKRRGS